jgi:hypothetical protein
MFARTESCLSVQCFQSMYLCRVAISTDDFIGATQEEAKVTTAARERDSIKRVTPSQGMSRVGGQLRSVAAARRLRLGPRPVQTGYGMILLATNTESSCGCSATARTTASTVRCAASARELYAAASLTPLFGGELLRAQATNQGQLDTGRRNALRRPAKART